VPAGCQATGLELERDVNDRGAARLSRLWEPISGGFCAGLGDMPERIGGLLEPLHVFGEVGRERVGLDSSVRIEADC
jgi:hypothetical protein